MGCRVWLLLMGGDGRAFPRSARGGLMFCLLHAVC